MRLPIPARAELCPPLSIRAAQAVATVSRRIVPRALALFCAAVLTASVAHASHFRGANLTWKRIGTGDTVELTVTEAWRVGAEGSLSYNWGDGGIFDMSGATIIATDPNFVVHRKTFQHTYASEGPYTITGSSCCRISTLVNAADQSEMVRSTVDLRNGNSGSPVISSPIILQMVKGGLNSVPLSFSDIDPADAVTFRMATSGESDIPSLASAGGQTISITPAGVLQWDTSSTSVGQLYAVQVIANDNHALTSGVGTSTVSFDFIVQIVDGTINHPPVASGNTGPFTIAVGQTFTNVITGTDQDGGNLTVTHQGLPPGATLTPVSGTTAAQPLAATFSWTPTANDSGSSFGITIVFTDPTGLQASKSFSVGVPANQPPTANAGPDQVANVDANCSATVQLNGSGTDPENGPLTFEWTGAFGTATGPTPTVTLPKGQNTVTLTVTDNKGATATDTVIVNVVDTTAPTLTLNAVNGALSSLGGASTYLTSVAGSPTGGLAHVHGIAYDLERNTVWVTDTELNNDILEFPATQPPGSTLNVLTRFHPPVASTIEGIYYDPTDHTLWVMEFNGQILHLDRSGNVLAGGFSIAGTVPSGTFGAIGLGIAIQGNFVWIDNGVSAYKFNKDGTYTGFTFSTGQPGLTYDPERNLIWTSDWYDQQFRAYDPNTGAQVFISTPIIPPITNRRGHDISIGAGKIWFGSEERAGGGNDGTAEVIYSIDINGGAVDKVVECSTPFVDPGATAVDNCGTPTVQVSGTVNTASVGTYALTYVAVDSSGNLSAPLTRTVTVIDTTPPTLITPGNIVANTDPGQCSANVAYSVVASDSCGLASLTCVASGATTGAVSPTGGVFNKGTTIVTATAVDAHNNVSAHSFTITVSDHQAPVVNVPASIVVGTAAGRCDATVDFSVTATDNCPGVALVNSVNSGSVFQKGTTTVTSVATDAAGNTTTKTFTVTVEDRELPKITSPGDITANAASGTCAANVAFTATATDNCPGVAVTYSQDPGTSFPKGDTIVTATATDASGNVATCTFKVTVKDVEPPAITTPAANQTVETDGQGNTAALSAWLASNGGTQATDHCGPVTWSNNFNRLTAACGSTGSATVTFVATDDSGNSSSSTATFAIVDTTPPAITTAAANATVETDGGGNTAALGAWLASNGGASATDIGSSVTWSNDYSALTKACGSTGAASVTFTATDACGNKSSTIATFRIVDTTAPTIVTAAANKVVETDGSGNTAELHAWLAGNGGASATDVGSAVTWSNNYTALTAACGSTGSAAVTFIATDACGNKSNTTATFTIVDTTAPALSSNVHDILPSDTPVTFTVTATDVGSTPTVTITGYTAQAVNGAGKVIDKTGSVVAQISGASITITQSGGVGTAITINASAVDACGNKSSASYVVNVLRPANEGVGNGTDGNTPGDAHNGGNDAPGTSPGNPGAKGKR